MLTKLWPKTTGLVRQRLWKRLLLAVRKPSFQRLNGVGKVVSGYQGKVKPYHKGKFAAVLLDTCRGNPNYHDPKKISFWWIAKGVLENPWSHHVKSRVLTGTQYCSAVFYYNDDQKRLAEEYKKKLDAWRRIRQSDCYGDYAHRILSCGRLPSELF